MVKKMSDKELKQPDVFQTTFARVMMFIAENRKQVYVASGAALLVVVLALGWFLYHLDYEKSAAKIYGKAQDGAMAGRTGGAELIKQYGQVIAQYPSSRAAMMARYHLGSLYYDQNNLDEAVKAYQAFLDQAPADSDLVTLAQNSLGYCYEAKKDLKNALQSFEKAEKSQAGASFASMTYRNLARTYEGMGEPKKALEYYQKALGKTKDPLTEKLIKRKIASLG